MKKLLSIFIWSFLLNLIWENLHAYLYANYLGGPITELILLRAAVIDACIIAILSAPFIYLTGLKKKSWLIIFLGIIVAIFIELYALHIGRWSYNEYMPIIPFLSVGLTPVLQLGLTGYLSYQLAMRSAK